MTASDDDMLATLEKRLGRLHARQRLGIEKDHEAQIFGQGLNSSSTIASSRQTCPLPSTASPSCRSATFMWS